MTYNEQLRKIAQEYTRSGEPWPATTRQIAAWAIQKGSWKPQTSSLVSQCADEIARAMREEYFVDAQGRAVRAKHAARMDLKGKQITLWADIRTASRGHMQVAFQQRRQQIFGECSQLKRDVDSFNENAAAEAPIQMVFDFTADLAEMDALRTPAPNRETDGATTTVQRGVALH